MMESYILGSPFQVVNVAMFFKVTFTRMMRGILLWGCFFGAFFISVALFFVGAI